MRTSERQQNSNGSPVKQILVVLFALSLSSMGCYRTDPAEPELQLSVSPTARVGSDNVREWGVRVPKGIPLQDQIVARWELVEPRDTYRVGEPILIRFVIANVSEHSPSCGFYGNHLIHGCAVELRTLNGELVPWNGEPPSLRDEGDEAFDSPGAPIRPHQSRVMTKFDLTDVFVISRPGWYEFLARPSMLVTITQPEHRGCVGVIPCEPVWFRIE